MCICVFSGEELFCKVTRELAAGEGLMASLLPPPTNSSSPLDQLSPPLSLVTQKQSAVKEEPLYPAALHSDIQLLPQQAGMAAILATAVVNSEWYYCIYVMCIMRYKIACFYITGICYSVIFYLYSTFHKNLIKYLRSTIKIHKKIKSNKRKKSNKS